MIDDVFDGLPIRAGREEGTKDISKTFYPLGDVAKFWGVTTEAAEVIIKNAPEGRGKEWLSTIPTKVLDAVLMTVYFPGLVYLGTQVKNPLGDRFIVHLCEVTIPLLIQDEPKGSALPVISTIGEANPFPAIRALVDEAEQTRASVDHAHKRIDKVEDKFDNPERWVTARHYAMQFGFSTDNHRTRQHPNGYLAAVGMRAAEIGHDMKLPDKWIDHDDYGRVRIWPPYMWARAFEEIHDD